MRKISAFSSVLALLFLVAFQQKESTLTPVRTIVIDPGHGGKDDGAGNGKEKRYVLDMALRLGQKIETEMPHVKVIYTRKTDIFIPLHERADIANRNKADLFISIHCNANPHSTKIYGTETYVMGLHKTEEHLDLAKRENSVVLLEDNYKQSYKGFDPRSPLGHIMLANFQSAFMNQSLSFAAAVEKKMNTVAQQRSRGVKQAGFVVIWRTMMPSVLVETGYLTNPNDAANLGSDTGRQQIAEAIFEAIKEYN